MATQYNSIIRLLTIDQCLRDRRKIYDMAGLIDHIAKALGNYDKQVKVSERTVYDDLAFLKDTTGPFAAPIHRTKDKGYHYTDSTYRIFQPADQPAAEERIDAIIRALRQVSNMPGFSELKDILYRLEATHLMDDDEKKPIVYVEQGLNTEVHTYIEILKQYILQKQVANITYTPFGKDAYARLISPYFIKEYNNRWFLFGHQHSLKDGDYQGITNLALDRIDSIRPSTKGYIDNEAIDPSRYFAPVIGVSVPDQAVEQVTFTVYGNRRHYVDTKKIHHSQRCTESTADSMTFRIDVIPNNELYSQLLSFGRDIEVIAPASVRAKMADYAKAMAALYDTTLNRNCR